MTNNDIGSPPVGSADVADSADADLVLRTRSGDAAAFGELWRRHYRSGVTVARSVSSSLDPDDLVQEAYTRIYQSIVTGGGPTGSFRAYLFTSIRNTAAGWGRARRETAIDALDSVEDPSTSDQATADALDHSLTHRAFRSLPTRWQEVLWYSEIERMKPAEIAPLLGMKATAVAQLTFRAREGLREAWIQAHLRSVVDGSDCQWTIEHLGAYSRANISRRDRVKVESHLAGCARCAIVASEAKEVSGRLALVLLPLTVGAVGTAGYLASLQGGGAALVTLAAMPSAVMQGAVTVLPAVPGAASVALGAAGSGTGAGIGGRRRRGSRVGRRRARIGRGAGSAVAGAALARQPPRDPQPRAQDRPASPLRRQVPRASPRPPRRRQQAAASSRASARWRASPPRASSSPAPSSPPRSCFPRSRRRAISSKTPEPPSSRRPPRRRGAAVRWLGGRRPARDGGRELLPASTPSS